MSVSRQMAVRLGAAIASCLAVAGLLASILSAAPAATLDANAGTPGASGGAAVGPSTSDDPLPAPADGSPSPFATADASPLTSQVDLGYPGFQPVDVFATAPQLASPDPRASAFPRDTTRPIPQQSQNWLERKSLGLIMLSDGHVVTLAAGTNPLATSSAAALPARSLLETRWTARIVEPPGTGVDEHGNSYLDRSYWNLCGPGAATIALYYWQRAVGYPNVTGTRGTFLDPYAAAGAAWPANGPRFVAPNGSPQRTGTYWSGSDRVSGYLANGRRFLMYLATQVQPPGWTAPGVDVFAVSGTVYYPLRGASTAAIRTAMNREIGGRDPGSWTEAWYASVSRASATFAADLRTAVMLDVGRDGVPVVAGVDTFDLPNWQAAKASKTPHIRHAIAIVGYDGASNPPTYTYMDTCGRGCNGSPHNTDGGLHVTTQDALVRAMQDRMGSGFVW